jgi:hypothetical protein
MEIIAGAPPAEYGDKTSVVINGTTRSGQGMTTPHRSVTASYGSFGTSGVGSNFGYGGHNAVIHCGGEEDCRLLRRLS